MYSKYITLGEIVKRFEPKLSVLCIELSKLAGSSGAFSAIYQSKPPDQRQEFIAIPSDFIEPFSQLAKGIYEECQKVGLPFSAICADRLVAYLSSINTNTTGFHSRCLELLQRIEDELSGSLLFSIPVDEQRLITESHLFGEKVSTAFPSAVFDIEEAGKCIAFERWTAVVFHLSRIAEIALVQICKRVGYNNPKPGFGDALKYMDSSLKKAREDYTNADPLFKNDIEYLSSVTAQMHAVNQAWRQRVSHLDRKYTKEEVLRIWTATRALIQQLADKLSETETNN